MWENNYLLQAIGKLLPRIRELMNQCESLDKLISGACSSCVEGKGADALLTSRDYIVMGVRNLEDITSTISSELPKIECTFGCIEEIEDDQMVQNTNDVSSESFSSESVDFRQEIIWDDETTMSSESRESDPHSSMISDHYCLTNSVKGYSENKYVEGETPDLKVTSLILRDQEDTILLNEAKEKFRSLTHILGEITEKRLARRHRNTLVSEVSIFCYILACFRYKLSSDERIADDTDSRYHSNYTGPLPEAKVKDEDEKWKEDRSSSVDCLRSHMLSTTTGKERHCPGTSIHTEAQICVQNCHRGLTVQGNSSKQNHASGMDSRNSAQVIRHEEYSPYISMYWERKYAHSDIFRCSNSYRPNGTCAGTEIDDFLREEKKPPLVWARTSLSVQRMGMM